MSPAVLTLRFRHNETLRLLERTAKALGVSVNVLAEVAIERELAALGIGLEGRLTRALESLKSYDPGDLDRLDRDIKAFARSEATKDPLQARLVESPDSYGIGALFADSAARGRVGLGRRPTGRLSFLGSAGEKRSA
jgi:hypothetical protein